METLKRFFKKHNKKIIAFIGVLATTICGILGITKTYAYNTNGNNEITTTLDQFVNGFNNLEYKTIERNNQTKPYMELQFANTTYMTLGFTTSFLGSEDDELITNYIRDYSLLMNYQIGYYRNGTTWTPLSAPSSYYEFSVRYTNYDLYIRSKYLINSDSYDINFDYSYRTSIMMYNNANINTSLFDDDTQFTFRLRIPNYSSTSYYLRIYNIDMVRDDEITITKYYDSLQEQLSQLQNQYDTLENNYNDLQDNYDTLENNYNDLQDDYTTLENNYNDLQENGVNNIYGGLYASLNGSIIKLYNINNPSLSYLLTQTPYAEDTLQVDNFYVGTGSLGPIVTNDDNHDLVDRCCILYTLHSPMLFNSLTFTRVENNQSRYIYLYFNDNTSETITLYDSGDYETLSTTWFNLNNKYITHIVTDCEPGYDVVYRISNTSDGQAYENGYDKGYAVGYNDHQSSITQAYNDLKVKYSNAYDNGYNAGFEAADRSEFASSGMNNLFNAILSYPVNFIKQVFNFEFMGVNVSAIITFIISIGIVAFIINYFRKH